MGQAYGGTAPVNLTFTQLYRTTQRLTTLHTRVEVMPRRVMATTMWVQITQGSHHLSQSTRHQLLQSTHLSSWGTVWQILHGDGGGGLTRTPAFHRTLGHHTVDPCPGFGRGWREGRGTCRVANFRCKAKSIEGKRPLKHSYFGVHGPRLTNAIWQLTNAINYPI